MSQSSTEPEKPHVARMTSDSTKERTRFGQLPVPAERADLYWSRDQSELQGITHGEHTALLIATPEFQEVIGPTLDKIDERNRTGYGNKMGRPSRWTALQLESVLLYRRIAGLSTIKRACERLSLDKDARLLLGLGEQLPSRATITRYVSQHFDERLRAELHREIDKRLRQRVIQLPGFDQEARILGMDGSQHGTHYTPPIPNSKENRKKEKTEGKTPRKIVNNHIPQGEPGAITAPTAGFVGGHHAKSGQGWQMLGLFTEHGTLLAWDISPLNENEKPAAERVLDSYKCEVLPYRSDKTLSVLSADAGFNSGKLRQQIQAMRIVPNIPKASHKAVPGLPEKKTKNAATRNKTWYPLRHPSKPNYANWEANGHGELRCSCGTGKTKRVFEVSDSGHLTIATKGYCSNCGSITITAGKWKRPDSKGYVRCYRDDHPDSTLGNSLTFNDPLSKAYGQDRFGWGESVHATINKRFGLLKDRSWMRDITEVETEFAIAASAISVLLLERHARQTTTANPGNGSIGWGIKQSTALPLAA
jgi:hypothetical protein